MVTAGQDEDIRLVRECLAGSQKAWTELYNAFSPLVEGIVRKQKWRPSQDDVEDVAQEVFLRISQRLDRFDGKCRLSTYIGGFAAKVAWEEIRRRGTAKRTGTLATGDNDDCIADIPGDDLLPPDIIERRELTVILKKGFQDLRDECRTILRMRDIDELSFKEIAAILGETENTLTQRAKRCRADLKVICDKLLRKGCRK